MKCSKEGCESPVTVYIGRIAYCSVHAFERVKEQEAKEKNS